MADPNVIEYLGSKSTAVVSFAGLFYGKSETVAGYRRVRAAP